MSVRSIRIGVALCRMCSGVALDAECVLYFQCVLCAEHVLCVYGNATLRLVLRFHIHVEISM
jgi:hypothetical protein